MLEKTFGVWLDSSADPQCFFPRSERAAEVEEKCESCPCYRGEMHQHQPRPLQNQENSQHDEQGVGDMQPCNSSRQDPPRHLVLLASK